MTDWILRGGDVIDGSRRPCWRADVTIAAIALPRSVLSIRPKGAREQAPVFDTVLAELRAGQKRSHWMWFIFPQLAGLGRSSTARFYGISSIDEARAYLAHPVLGPRLDLCTRIVLTSKGPSLHAIGSPDDLSSGHA